MSRAITQMVYPEFLSRNDMEFIESNQINSIFLRDWNRIHEQLFNIETSYVWVFIETDSKEEKITYRSFELMFENWLYDLLSIRQMKIDVLAVPFQRHQLSRFSIMLQENLYRIQNQNEKANVLAYLPQDMPIVHTQLLSSNHQLFAEHFTNLFIKDGQIVTSNPYLKKQPPLWLHNFRSFVFDYDYIAALEVINDLPESQTKVKMQQFLKMMINRFNFAFEAANDRLDELIEHFGTIGILQQTQCLIQPLIGKDKKARDLSRIQELTRHMETMMERNDIFSFLVRFYRLREALLFYLFNYVEESGFYHFDPTIRKPIYDRYEELEELYGLHDIRKYFGSYFFIKSNNVNQAILYRNRSFIGHSRQPIDRESFWKAYAGNEKVNIKKAKLKFQNDLSVLLKDLGLKKDHNIEDLNEWILTYARKLEVGDGTDTDNSFSS